MDCFLDRKRNHHDCTCPCNQRTSTMLRLLAECMLQRKFMRSRLLLSYGRQQQHGYMRGNKLTARLSSVRHIGIQENTEASPLCNRNGFNVQRKNARGCGQVNVVNQGNVNYGELVRRVGCPPSANKQHAMTCGRTMSDGRQGKNQREHGTPQ